MRVNIDGENENFISTITGMIRLLSSPTPEENVRLSLNLEDKINALNNIRTEEREAT